jgi:hypothetical protein
MNIYMSITSYIVKFFTKNKNPQVFSKDYRDGYNKLWINNLRDYKP